MLRPSKQDGEVVVVLAVEAMRWIEDVDVEQKRMEDEEWEGSNRVGREERARRACLCSFRISRLEVVVSGHVRRCLKRIDYGNRHPRCVPACVWAEQSSNI
jgi:hypothetical protein